MENNNPPKNDRLSKYKFVFFGTADFSKNILVNMKNAGLIPTLVVTGEDKPVGRKLTITPPPVKIFAIENNIPYLQLKTLKNDDAISQIKSFSDTGFDFFLVVSYGKIIPKEFLNFPKKGVLNVHPSLLPKLRGASPIQSAILEENKTGITIMLLDEEMDHGDILSQRELTNKDFKEFPTYESELEEVFLKVGSELLTETIEKWMNAEIQPIPQNHNLATFCKKIKKEDALLNLTDSPEKNLRKIMAYENWPKAYFFEKNKDGKETRIIAKKAHIEERDGEKRLILDRVIPEGRKEMNYEDWMKNF